MPHLPTEGSGRDLVTKRESAEHALDYPRVAERLTDGEARRVAARVVIHGAVPSLPEQLSSDVLARSNMLPRYCVSVEGRKVYLAGQLFHNHLERPAILAYVETDAGNETQYVARTLYGSNSGVLFRYLPQTIFGWFHKGWDENSVTVPPELQAAIFQVRVEGGFASIDQSTRAVLFVGTTRSSINLSNNGGDLTCQKEISEEPRLIHSVAQGHSAEHEKPEPNEVVIERATDHPDLRSPRFAFLAESPSLSSGLPGAVIVRGRASPNTATLRLAADKPLEGSVCGERVIELSDGISLEYKKTSRSEESDTFEFRAIKIHGKIYTWNPSLLHFSGDDSFTLELAEVHEFSLPGSIAVTLSEQGRVVQVETPTGRFEPVYGVHAAHVFRSQGNPAAGQDQLDYTFLTDELGRSFVGAVQPVCGLTSLGLSPEWCDAGALVTPLYEYESQHGGWGNRLDRRARYIGMWNYVRQLPLVEEFRRQYLERVAPGITSSS